MVVKIKAMFVGMIFAALLFFAVFAIATPINPDMVNVTANETKPAASQKSVNISGKYIATLNITANPKNVRWKAFVGWVSGSFTLKDSTGATLFDWALETIDGEVYATRSSAAITWTNINCSNVTILEAENVAMEHSNKDDNITATFNTTSGATHSKFVVSGRTITANTCPTLNTYVDNATQDSKFQEVALYDGTSDVFATIIEHNETGFDHTDYDFQMIVPENGNETWSGSTAYYIYAEIS